MGAKLAAENPCNPPEHTKRRQVWCHGTAGGGEDQKRHAAEQDFLAAIPVRDRPPDEKTAGVAQAKRGGEGEGGIPAKTAADRRDQRDGQIELGEYYKCGSHQEHHGAGGGWILRCVVGRWWL